MPQVRFRNDKGKVKKMDFFIEMGIPLMVLIFSGFFYFTGTLEGCWYRRLVFPLMIASLSIFYPGNTPATITLLTAAALTFFGFKGRGQEKKENNKTGEQPEKDGKEDDEK